MNTTQRRWFVGIVGGAGLLMHFGTALLRLDAFFPRPKLVDFAGLYAAAWALRLDRSPYELSPGLLETLRTQANLTFRPPVSYNPPVWSWLAQPLTFVSAPAAMIVWLLVVLASVAWSAVALARIAGYQRWKERGIVFLLVLSFGPMFLDLSLGQMSFFLLVAALLIGRALRAETKASCVSAALVGALAAAAKLFPILWLGALFFLRRWGLFVLTTVAVIVVLGLPFLFAPAMNQDFWFDHLPGRVTSAVELPGVDDQSLLAWLGRLGRPHTFQTSGLSVRQKHTVTWSPPWSLAPATLHWAALFLTALLALVPVGILVRASAGQAEGAFYLWVLYALLPLPHIQRYNHVLLLPAMAWLWGQGGWGRKLAILAYFLAGLSRLNHLWVISLDAPWGPLAAGFGLYTVFLLGAGMAVYLWPSGLALTTGGQKH